MRKLISLTALLLVLPLYSHAASFDCARAKSPVEKMICADPHLGQLDEEISSAYHKAYASADKKYQPLLLVQQRTWLKQRSATPELKAAMAERLDDLKNTFVTVNGLQFLRLAGLHLPPYLLTTLPGTAAYNKWVDQIRESAASDPDDAEQFNRCEAMYDAVTKRTPDGQNANEADQKKMDDSCEGTSVTTRFYTVDFASPDLISVHESTSEMSWHAAHPSNEDVHYNWWLVKSGKIAEKEIFPGKGSARIIQKWVDKTLKEEFGKAQATDDGSPRPALNPDNWGLTGTCLCITGQGYDYEVGRGYVEINVPWEAFKGVADPKLIEMLRRVPPITDPRFAGVK